MQGNISNSRQRKLRISSTTIYNNLNSVEVIYFLSVPDKVRISCIRILGRIIPTLAKRVFSRRDEIENSSHARLGEESLLVKVYNPVLVIEKILILLQTKLEGPGLVQSSRLGFIGRVHHCLHHSFICCQINWIVCHNLKQQRLRALSFITKTTKTKCFNWTTFLELLEKQDEVF